MVINFPKFVSRVVRMSVQDFATPKFHNLVFNISIFAYKVGIFSARFTPYPNIYNQISFKAIWRKFIFFARSQRTKPEWINTQPFVNVIQKCQSIFSRHTQILNKISLGHICAMSQADQHASIQNPVQNISQYFQKGNFVELEKIIPRPKRSSVVSEQIIFYRNYLIIFFIVLGNFIGMHIKPIITSFSKSRNWQFCFVSKISYHYYSAIFRKNNAIHKLNRFADFLFGQVDCFIETFYIVIGKMNIIFRGNKTQLYKCNYSERAIRAGRAIKQILIFCRRSGYQFSISKNNFIFQTGIVKKSVFERAAFSGTALNAATNSYPRKLHYYRWHKAVPQSFLDKFVHRNIWLDQNILFNGVYLDNAVEPTYIYKLVLLKFLSAARSGTTVINLNFLSSCVKIFHLRLDISNIKVVLFNWSHSLLKNMRREAAWWTERGRGGIPPPNPPLPPRPSGFQSGVVQEIGSHLVVNILHNQTFFKFADHFGGGAKRRPSISPRQIISARRAQARIAVGQDKVQLPCDLNSVSLHLLC